jgi:hypothetical protein
VAKRKAVSRFVICIQNKGYPVALEVLKVYQALPDAPAEQRGLVRVIDESGEDYLYPEAFFVEVDIPRAATKAFANATR